MGACTIVLADNHALLRQGLRRILDEQPELEVTGEAGEGGEFLKLLGTSSAGPHLVILSLSLPNLELKQAIDTIKSLHPRTKVLVLGLDEDVEYMRRALSSGAEGYVVKERADTELLRAVETIRQGGVYMPPALANGSTVDTMEGRGTH